MDLDSAIVAQVVKNPSVFNELISAGITKDDFLDDFQTSFANRCLRHRRAYSFKISPMPKYTKTKNTRHRCEFCKKIFIGLKAQRFCNVQCTTAWRGQRKRDRFWEERYNSKGQRLCRKCGKWRDPQSDFHKNGSTADGLANLCKPCANANTLRWGADNEDRRRTGSYMRRYGISLDEYNALLKRQKNRCAICRAKPSKRRILDVDHCHESGKIRGLLCNPCNMAVGLIKNNPRTARRMAVYLGRS